MVRFHVQPGSSRVDVEIHNPSAEWGLVGSGFELTAVGKDGTDLAVFGSAGPAGAACCTILQLPPGRTYALHVTPADPDAVRDFRIRASGPWIRWSTVQPPVVEVAGAKLRRTADGSAVTGVTGQVSFATGQAHDVVVFALVEYRAGFAWLETTVMCLPRGQPAAFEIGTTAPLPRNARLDQAFAFTTTVPGTNSAGPRCN